MVITRDDQSIGLVAEIDALIVTNRDRFASAWKRAVDGEDSGAV